jgi:hypothetical protein
MARFEGIIIDKELAKTICIYKMGGEIFIRTKSSLSRKRVLKSKAFKKTRQYASDLAKASRIGSEIYQEIRNRKRDRSLYQAITGEAASLLYEGVKEEEVVEKLRRKWLKQ